MCVVAFPLSNSKYISDLNTLNYIAAMVIYCVFFNFTYKFLIIIKIVFVVVVFTFFFFSFCSKNLKISYKKIFIIFFIEQKKIIN
jgi:hypothetical protein